MIRNFVYALCCIFFWSFAYADDPHQHEHSPAAAEKLGTVQLKTSCDPAVEKDFNRAMTLLHSFWYTEAEKAFQQVVAKDEDCVMAYWGIAMSNYHPLWEPPKPDELERGKKAAEKAQTFATTNDREKMFVAAIAAYYKDSDKLDHRTRAKAFATGMEQLHQKFPDDTEAAIFYALALNGTALPSDKTYANQKKALSILTPLFEKQPDHPGLAHYIIHSSDYPALAKQGLDAARKYAKIAPDSPHALHMPSHIFTRLGYWDESISSNKDSASAAVRHVQKTMPGAGSFDQLHAMDYLVYAYLQLGQDKKAAAVLEEAKKMTKVDRANIASAYAFAAMPARFFLERKKWVDAAALNLAPDFMSWAQYPWAEGITYFARAIGSARTGDAESARNERDQLREAKRILVERKDEYWATQVDIQLKSAEAWIAFAEDKKEEAVRLMREAADLETSTEKHPVTPGAIVPARELLGEMLMEMNRPAEALKEFQAVLASAPRRLNALNGAATAAKKSGNEQLAQQYYSELVELTQNADTQREEIVAARKSAAKK